MDSRVRLSPAFVALVCGMIWLDRDGLVLPFLLACALHEAGHLLVMRACGLRCERICVGLTGAVIETVFPSRSSELVCPLAGPMMNLLLFAGFFRIWPVFARVNAALCLYNLLPVYPLDGGRIIRCLFGETIAKIIGWATGIGVAALSVYAAVFLHFGLMPLAFAAVFLKNILVKCRQG